MLKILCCLPNLICAANQLNFYLKEIENLIKKICVMMMHKPYLTYPQNKLVSHSIKLLIQNIFVLGSAFE